MLTFSKKYFLLALLLFIVEILIALYAHDAFVRPYVGDYLVVPLMYCALRTILKASPLKVVIAVLLFAYIVELLQYFRIIYRLGLEHNVLARTVIGSGAEWADVVAYTLGAISILLLESKRPAFARKAS